MATGFTVEEVRELVLDDSDCDESIQSDEERDEDEEKLGALLDSFDGGEQFNQSFFKENGVRVLMPLVQAAKPCDDSQEQPQRLSGKSFHRSFFTSNISMLPNLSANSSDFDEFQCIKLKNAYLN